MLELEFKQVQDGMDVLVRMSFLNTSLFAPTERQKRDWDKYLLKYRLPKSNFVWQKENLQSLVYWATCGLKYSTKTLKPIYVADARALDWILRRYKIDLQLLWKRADGNTYFKWQFLRGKSPEWGNLHLNASFALPESSAAPTNFQAKREFDKLKAFRFLKSNKGMMERFEELVPSKMNAEAFFQLYYQDLFDVAFSSNILTPQRQTAMLQANSVWQKAYEQQVLQGSMTHTDFFRFAVSSNRVLEGIDEEHLGGPDIDELCISWQSQLRKSARSAMCKRLLKTDKAFDLRETESEGFGKGYGSHEQALLYDIDIECPKKKIVSASNKLLQQINNRSDKDLNHL